MQQVAYTPDPDVIGEIFTKIKLPTGGSTAFPGTQAQAVAYEAFSIKVGETGQGYSSAVDESVTNKDFKELPRGFLLEGVAISIIHDVVTAPSNVADAYALANGIAAQLKLGNTTINLGLIRTLAAEHGLDLASVTAASGGSTTQVVVAQSGYRVARKALRRPVLLAKGSNPRLAWLGSVTPTAQHYLLVEFIGRWVD